MSKSNLLLIFFVSLLFASNSLVAQSTDTIAREAWFDHIIEVVYAEEELSEDETEWVKYLLIEGCKCNALEKTEEMEKCGKVLLKSSGLPESQEDLDRMTVAQQRKFSLLTPLMSVVGTCPE
ncbi:hypothetical protein CEQ90_15055 [Lewinellaceae bacterium SD302]|nr:hypothetical protein CEQ90_15055 [Lewinellaceae bacterium SD302]